MNDETAGKMVEALNGIAKQLEGIKEELEYLNQEEEDGEETPDSNTE